MKGQSKHLGGAKDSARIVDVAIIGAGYAGLSAAIHLAEPGVRIEVFDADVFAANASGHNFGSIAAVAPVFINSSEIQGKSEVDSFSKAASTHLEILIKSMNRDCGWKRPGHITLAMNDNAASVMASRFERYRMLYGHEVEWLDETIVRQETKARGVVAGLLNHRFALIRPFDLLISLREQAENKGVRINFDNRVLAVHTKTNAVDIDFSNAKVSAGQVLICAEGAWKFVPQPIQEHLYMHRTYLLLTKPLPQSIKKLISLRPRVYGTSSIEKDYFRINEDGRLLFGSRLNLSDITDMRRATSSLCARMQTYFPDLQGMDVEPTWCGEIGFTYDGLPRVGQAGPLLWCGGYCGSGIAMATYCGAALGNLARGMADTTSLSKIALPAIPDSACTYNTKPHQMSRNIL